MHDTDADEVVVQRRSRRMPASDMALGSLGIVLAGLASYFPWWAYLNQDRISIPTLWEGRLQDLPTKIGNGSLSLAQQQRREETQAAVDQLLTASLPDVVKKPSGPPDQPFPPNPNFRLRHVANGRALIEDDKGVYLVRIGSLLPDDSQLATLEQRDGRWVLVTSRGDVFQSQQ
ncbi:flagellar protein [Rhizobium rhizosphaerae]|uniref:Flagellar protein n=2 Tax=Xaviernesmea rhizosphaerae TaxID=1672749 RepID=A0A1Q9AIK5_9HYPH|nr:flagellar protein [Xaviernesmea rhizosphaerae]OQP83549.1 flagellar protein [Xaviernesmea rhizosphaerae]